MALISYDEAYLPGAVDVVSPLSIGVLSGEQDERGGGVILGEDGSPGSQDNYASLHRGRDSLASFSAVGSIAEVVPSLGGNARTTAAIRPAAVRARPSIAMRPKAMSTIPLSWSVDTRSPRIAQPSNTAVTGINKVTREMLVAPAVARIRKKTT